MDSPTLPDQHLLSRTLAATIGLEEAFMWQVLTDLFEHREKTDSITLGYGELASLLPFWKPGEIKRIQEKLHNLGMIAVEPAGPDAVRIAITGQARSHGPRKAPEAAAATGEDDGKAAPIPPGWQPDESTLQLCRQHAIPDAFIQRMVPLFVNHWRTRGEARSCWGNVFHKRVLREWRHAQTRQGAQAAAVSAAFSGKARPGPIPDDWKPGIECYELLQLGEMDEEWADSLVPGFIAHWKNRGEARACWNTEFLQFARRAWAGHLDQLENNQQATEQTNAENRFPGGTVRQAIQAKLEQITDRSWAG